MRAKIASRQVQLLKIISNELKMSCCETTDCRLPSRSIKISHGPAALLRLKARGVGVQGFQRNWSSREMGII